MKATRVFLSLVIAFAAIALPAYGAAPCCPITGINAKTGMVTAKETATGRTFQFKVTNAALLKTLSVGTPIYANFSTKQVSTNGEVPCCTIVSLSAAAPVAPSAKVATAPAAMAVQASTAINSSATAAGGGVSPSTGAASSVTPKLATSTGFQCDPGNGVCYCTGGKNSADCQALAGDSRCGSKVGCDSLGRCYCAPPIATTW